MRKIVFTLCSNNYLAQAKTLGDSLKVYNPDVHFIIGLVDNFHPNIDYSLFDSFEIVPFDKIGYDFSSMINEYNIVEFNTAVKPFYINYLFERYKDADLKICYLDPDIEVFHPFDDLFELLSLHDFVVTPHIVLPRLELSPYEPRFLNVGVFNLGFLGLRRSEQSRQFVFWWMERLKTLCKIDLPKGLFVDQLWVNYLPALFDGSHITKNPGFNMAYWNMHERILSIREGVYYVNDRFPLIFFHFSSYDPKNPEKISRYSKLSFVDRPDVSKLFSSYREKLLRNNYEVLSATERLMQFRKNHPIADRRKIDKSSFKMKVVISLKSRINRFFMRYYGV